MASQKSLPWNGTRVEMGRYDIGSGGEHIKGWMCIWPLQGEVQRLTSVAGYLEDRRVCIVNLYGLSDGEAHLCWKVAGRGHP